MQAVEYFGELNAAFVLLRPHKDGTNNAKLPLKRNWLAHPEKVQTALLFAKQGGNVGLLTGHNGLIFLDLDAGYTTFRRQYPELAQTPTVVRPDASERAKLCYRIVDNVPPSARDPTSKVEVVSLGRHGCIHGRHPDGALFELTQTEHPIVELTITELETLWQELTGKPLRAVRAPPRHRSRQQPSPGNLVARVKAVWQTCWDVFEHHGITGRTRIEGTNTRIIGYSGLTVKTDDPRFFFNFADNVGGDQIDAWGWVENGASWSRYDPPMFKTVLTDMADTAGIERKEN